MAITYTCEGTQGATVATTDFSPNLVQYNPGGGTATYDTAYAAQGKTGIKIVSSTSGVTSLRAPSDASNATQSVSFEMYLPKNSTPQALWLHTPRLASGTTIPAFRLGVDSSGTKLTVMDNANTYLATSDTLDLSTLYRVAYVLTVGPTTSNGSLTLHVYKHGDTTPVFTCSTTSGNFGTGTIVAFDYGVLTTPTAVSTMGVDSIQNVAGSTTELAALANPVVASLALSPNSGTMPYTMTATVTASGGSGTYTYAMNWGDGTTVAAQSSNTFTKTVNDSSTFTGRTATATVTEA